MISKFISFVTILAFLVSSKIMANEKDIYEFSWLDPDKEVYVLQNRKFRKANHLTANLGGGITTSGAFVDAKTIQGRVGYFFTEDWGFEILYAKNSGAENDTAKAVRNNNGLGTTGSTPFRRIVNNYMGGMIAWSPFYSKINTFNKIIYMDWIFGLGVAQLEEHNNKAFFTSQSTGLTETTEKHTGIVWQAGMKFFLTESLSLRTDLTAVHYQAKQVSNNADNFYSNFDATLSLGYTF